MTLLQGWLYSGVETIAMWFCNRGEIDFNIEYNKKKMVIYSQGAELRERDRWMENYWEGRVILIKLT